MPKCRVQRPQQHFSGSNEKAFDWPHALHLYEMLQRQSMADLISYNTAISACSVQWTKAVQLFGMMRRHLDEEFICPAQQSHRNNICFTGPLSTGLVKTGWGMGMATSRPQCRMCKKRWQRTVQAAQARQISTTYIYLRK